MEMLHTARIIDRLIDARRNETAAPTQGAQIDSTDMSKSHNNILESDGVLMGLLRYTSDLEGRRLWSRSDNTAALAALRRAYSPSSTMLTEMGLKMNVALATMRTTLVACTHLAGDSNTIADDASRRWINAHRRLEWPICPAALRRLLSEVGASIPEIDAFATAANSKCPAFWSLHPDPLAAGTDAMAQQWSGRSLLLNPPFALFPAVVAKLQHDRPAHAVVIAPHWPNRQWHRRLEEMTAASALVPADAILSGPNASEALLNPSWRIRLHLLQPPRPPDKGCSGS
jgi:hypothetical protein